MRTVLIFLLERIQAVISAGTGMVVAAIIMDHLGYRIRVERRPRAPKVRP